LKAKAAAQEKYKKTLDIEFDKASKAGSLEDVKAIQKEQEEFAADESKWKSAPHKAAIRKYNSDLEAAGKKFFTALDALVKEQVRKKNIEVAEKIKEIKDNGMEGIPATGEGGWISLLPMIDPQKDTVTGTWSLKYNELLSDKSAFARIEIPYQPPEEYDFRVVFTRLDGREDVMMMMSSAGTSFAWQMGSYDNTLFAFIMINGNDALKNPSAVKKANCLENNRRYTSVVLVRKHGVTANLDGQIVSKYNTDFKDMGPQDCWKLKSANVLGLGSRANPTVFHRVDLRGVTGTGHRTR